MVICKTCDSNRISQRNVDNSCLSGSFCLNINWAIFIATLHPLVGLSPNSDSLCHLFSPGSNDANVFDGHTTGDSFSGWARTHYFIYFLFCIHISLKDSEPLQHIFWINLWSLFTKAICLVHFAWNVNGTTQSSFQCLNMCKRVSLYSVGVWVGACAV